MQIIILSPKWAHSVHKMLLLSVIYCGRQIDSADQYKVSTVVVYLSLNVDAVLLWFVIVGILLKKDESSFQ